MTPTTPSDFTPPASPSLRRVPSQDQPQQQLEPTRVPSKEEAEEKEDDFVCSSPDREPLTKDTHYVSSSEGTESPTEVIVGSVELGGNVEDKNFVEVVLNEGWACDDLYSADGDVDPVDDDLSMSPLPYDDNDNGDDDVMMDLSDDLLRLPIAPVGPDER